MASVGFHVLNIYHKNICVIACKYILISMKHFFPLSNHFYFKALKNYLEIKNKRAKFISETGLES